MSDNIRDQKIWYKVVGKHDECSFNWVNSSFKNKICKFYKDGEIIKASRKTQGLFIFRELRYAKNFIFHSGLGYNVKIKLVEPIDKPKIFTESTKLIEYQSITNISTYSQIKKHYIKNFEIKAPLDTYRCYELKVIGDYNNVSVDKINLVLV